MTKTGDMKIIDHGKCRGRQGEVYLTSVEVPGYDPVYSVVEAACLEDASGLAFGRGADIVRNTQMAERVRKSLLPLAVQDEVISKLLTPMDTVDRTESPAGHGDRMRCATHR